MTDQNKAIWKNQLKQDKKLEEISKVLKKMHQEDTLTSNFFEVNVIFLGFVIFFTY